MNDSFKSLKLGGKYNYRAIILHSMYIIFLMVWNNFGYFIWKYTHSKRLINDQCKSLDNNGSRCISNEFEILSCAKLDLDSIQG